MDDCLAVRYSLSSAVPVHPELDRAGAAHDLRALDPGCGQVVVPQSHGSIHGLVWIV
jgi:hypothetical protein